MSPRVPSRWLAPLLVAGALLWGCARPEADDDSEASPDAGLPPARLGLQQSLVFPEVRSGAAVFERREETFQPVIRSRLAALASSVDAAHLRRIRHALGRRLRDAFAFTGLPLGPKPLTPEVERQGVAQLRRLYRRMDQDLPGFLRWLRDGAPVGTATPAAVARAHLDEDALVEWRKRYYTFVLALLDLHPDADQARLLLAERLLRFMVDDASHEAHGALIASATALPLAVMLCEATWKGLSSTGWRLWRWETLQALRRRSEAGQEVVYVAGGSDLFQLLVNGVRHLRIIDPMFPVQAPYYCLQWEFLIRGRFQNGGVGDRIVIAPFSVRTPTGIRKSPTLVLTRTAFRETGVIDAGKMNNGAVCRLATGETRWRVEADDGSPPGTLIFERRFVTQADLVPRPDRVLLVSFNELYFLITPHADDSWGIDPRRFAPGLQIYVKQLRRPMTVPELLRLRHQLASKRYECVMGTEVR